MKIEPLAPLVQRVLERLGLGMGADRAYIFETHAHPEFDGQILASQRFEWCQQDIEPQIDNPELQNLPIQQLFPRWLELLKPITQFLVSLPASRLEERCAAASAADP